MGGKRALRSTEQTKLVVSIHARYKARRAGSIGCVLWKLRLQYSFLEHRARAHDCRTNQHDDQRPGLAELKHQSEIRDRFADIERMTDDRVGPASIQLACFGQH